jgi:hypothetical protein
MPRPSGGRKAALFGEAGRRLLKNSAIEQDLASKREKFVANQA